MRKKSIRGKVQSSVDYLRPSFAVSRLQNVAVDLRAFGMARQVAIVVTSPLSCSSVTSSRVEQSREANEERREDRQGGGELGWFYGHATRGRVVEWRFLLRTSGGPGPGPSSISPPRTAHSIISVMMSARAGGPRNTHQQKDYPSSYHHLPPSLLSIFSFILPSLPPSLSLSLSLSLYLPLSRSLVLPH